MNSKRTHSLLVLITFSLVAIDFTDGLRKKFIGLRRMGPTQFPPHRPPTLSPLPPDSPQRPPELSLLISNGLLPQKLPTLKPVRN